MRAGNSDKNDLVGREQFTDTVNHRRIHNIPAFLCLFHNGRKGFSVIPG